MKTLFTLALSVLPLAGLQAAPTPTVSLYDGKDTAQSNVSVSAWGGGTGQEATDVTLFGGHSLKITTLDTHQGARLTFKSPISLAGDDRVFQLTLRRGGATLHYDPRLIPGYDPKTGEAPNTGDASDTGSTPGAGNYPGAGANPGPGGGGRRGGRRGGFGNRNGAGTNPNGGNGRGGGRGGEEAPIIPPVDAVRLEFTLANGKTADIYRTIPDSTDATAGEGWYSVNVPVSALKLGGTDSPLKSVTVGGNQFGIFYIGRMKLASKTAAPTLTIDGPDKVAPGQPVTLRVKGDTDLDSLKYTWDFNSGDGQPASAIGTIATTRYYTPSQDVTATLTATDLDGVNPPVKVSKTIHVSEGRSPGGVSPGVAPGGNPGIMLPPGGFPGMMPPPGGNPGEGGPGGNDTGGGPGSDG